MVTMAWQHSTPTGPAAWSIHGDPDVISEAAAVLFGRLERRADEPMGPSEVVVLQIAHLLDAVAASARREAGLPHTVVSAATRIAYSVLSGSVLAPPSALTAVVAPVALHSRRKAS
jgi:hypothetical protein